MNNKHVASYISVTSMDLHELWRAVSSTSRSTSSLWHHILASTFRFPHSYWSWSPLAMNCIFIKVIVCQDRTKTRDVPLWLRFWTCRPSHHKVYGRARNFTVIFYLSIHFFGQTSQVGKGDVYLTRPVWETLYFEQHAQSFFTWSLFQAQLILFGWVLLVHERYCLLYDEIGARICINQRVRTRGIVSLIKYWGLTWYAEFPSRNSPDPAILSRSKLDYHWLILD